MNFCIPFAFDTFGSLAPEAINFLTRVQRVIHSNCSTQGGGGGRVCVREVGVCNSERIGGAACCPSTFWFDVT
ncbi:hypothetical protein Hanom_Chr08g00750411 [Helianthus anomalus]